MFCWWERKKPVIVDGLTNAVTLHPLDDAEDKDAFLNSIADKIRAIAVSLTAHKIGADLMQRLPKLELVSTFGVGYDHVDAKWAGAHGITVTNTPGVLNEEVADTALGSAALDGSRTAAGRALSARRQMAVGQLSADQHAARPHRRHGGHGADRPGHRAADRGVRRAGGLSQPQAAGRA